ncbi:Petrobactin import ATP-binding protein FpuC [Paenibacillus plantiphilus]|uniref:Petrobactin import ATP-binding protein FpuC n=1 Tax=Paenibacillus plantiphilus TaxID=2905650 RepID=A0ABM9C2Z8_9BACL|nr:ABC transporter ATP-binding protein [Paenibacillus plantiphilus]CAH1200521.1 Petrobactin import ATP-binding protein FpuC [Paenibacillus plantiphilus]
MELKGITFSYDKKQDQLKGISGTIEVGRITTIIGPNGSGKSTLLGVMARNFAPQSGAAVLDGKAVASYHPKELARKLAVVHQQNDAPSDLTVEGLTAFGRLPHRSMWSQRGQEDEDAIEWALESTNLLGKRRQRIVELSGGERQRVWLAMALAQKTPILFLDEPTTFLDVYHQIEVLELIRRLNVRDKLTIVMVLHDMNQAVRYSDKLIVMKDGQAMLEGAPQQIVTEQMMREIYGVEVAIKHDEQTGMYIVPLGIGRG